MRRDLTLKLNRAINYTDKVGEIRGGDGWGTVCLSSELDYRFMILQVLMGCNIQISNKNLTFIFTVGEAVRSTCGNSHKEEEKEEKNFHLSLLQTIL